ncbi:MAG: phenylacetate--CoA ligase [Candidatus Latescibacterota bacterium]
MIYDPACEALPRQDMEQLQIERLQTTLNRAYRNVAFYRQAFDRACVDIERIRSVADMRVLPFTTKADLRQAYPYGMFAVPLRDIVRLHATSGTTGTPIVTGYTRNDVGHWSALVARQLVAVGITEHDVVQIAFHYGLFTGGLGFHYGAERIGASVIPASAGTHAREQNLIMKDYKATALLATPSYALTMANALERMGIHPEQLALKVGVLGAEPWSEAVREALQSRLRVPVYDTYGVAEIMGPGISGECTEQCGLHLNEDHFIPEIVDPQTALPLPAGQTGELVLTTVTKEGFPLVRYRTGDLTHLCEGPCRCGRTLVRMARVSGRTDDMLFVNGQKVFPSEVEAVLLQVAGIEPGYRIVLEREAETEVMRVQVAPSAESGLFDEIRGLERLREDLERRLCEHLEVPTRVTFVEASSLRAQTGKKRYEVVDHRTIR